MEEENDRRKISWSISQKLQGRAVIRTCNLCSQTYYQLRYEAWLQTKQNMASDQGLHLSATRII